MQSQRAMAEDFHPLRANVSKEKEETPQILKSEGSLLAAVALTEALSALTEDQESRLIQFRNK